MNQIFKRQCTASCKPQTMFPNGQSQLVFDCVNGEYVAEAGEFMDYEPECEPQCQNGGDCVGINICKCPQEFRGAYCQYGKNSPH